MKRTPKGATAPAFLVITSYPRYTESIGTKEQLVLLYPDLEARFLDGNRYSKYGDGCYLLRKKGGLFKARRFHEERKQDERIVEEFRIFPSPEADRYRTQWRGVDGDKEMRDQIDQIVRDVHHMFVEEQKCSLRKKITLVKPTDSFPPALPEERRGKQ